MASIIDFNQFKDLTCTTQARQCIIVMYHFKFHEIPFSGRCYCSERTEGRTDGYLGNNIPKKMRGIKKLGREEPISISYILPYFFFFKFMKCEVGLQTKMTQIIIKSFFL